MTKLQPNQCVELIEKLLRKPIRLFINKEHQFYSMANGGLGTVIYQHLSDETEHGKCLRYLLSTNQLSIGEFSPVYELGLEELAQITLT